MTLTCSVPTCGNKSKSEDADVILARKLSFYYPPKCEYKRAFWEEYLHCKLSEDSLVCSRHFEEKSFRLVKGHRLLKKKALPKIVKAKKQEWREITRELRKKDEERAKEAKKAAGGETAAPKQNGSAAATTNGDDNKSAGESTAAAAAAEPTESAAASAKPADDLSGARKIYHDLKLFIKDLASSSSSSSEDEDEAERLRRDPMMLTFPGVAETIREMEMETTDEEDELAGMDKRSDHSEDRLSADDEDAEVDSDEDKEEFDSYYGDEVRQFSEFNKLVRRATDLEALEKAIRYKRERMMKKIPAFMQDKFGLGGGMFKTAPMDSDEDEDEDEDDEDDEDKDEDEKEDEDEK